MSTVSPDIATIAKAILTLFDVVSFLFLCIVYYLVFIGNAISLKYWRHTKHTVAVLAANPAVAAISIAPAHFFAIRADILASLLSLGVGTILYCLFYFLLFRPLIRSADSRIQNAVMMWGAVTALTISALLFLYLGRDYITIDAKAEVSYDLLIKSGSILISAVGIAFTFVMGSEQANRNSRRQLYQTLELQSVELFRFECEKSELVRGLWFKEKESFGSKPEDPVLRYQIRQYACQILNLFEMATRFRSSRVLPEDVFGSWVIWIWELCNCKQFQDLWLDDDDLPSNYVRDLRDIITAGVGIAIRDEVSDVEKRAKFFEKVAERLNCWEIEEWFSHHDDIKVVRKLRAKRLKLEARRAQVATYYG
jgi:hypothetical protein